MSESLVEDRLAIVDERVASFFEALDTAYLKVMYDPSNISDAEQDVLIEGYKERALDLMDACQDLAEISTDVDQVDSTVCANIAEERIKYNRLRQTQRPHITSFLEGFNLVELYDAAAARSASRQT